MNNNSLEDPIEKLFNELIDQQQCKVLNLARERIKHLTGDDINNPQDYSILREDPVFNYEDGILTGLLTAQMAVRAALPMPPHEKGLV